MAVRKQQPGAKGAGLKAKAYDASGKLDKAKLQENRRRLGEAPDGKTREMKERRRGTFP
jgi:hypothetical protein